MPRASLIRASLAAPATSDIGGMDLEAWRGRESKVSKVSD